jgi:hypothetical protein
MQATAAGAFALAPRTPPHEVGLDAAPSGYVPVR